MTKWQFRTLYFAIIAAVCILTYLPLGVGIGCGFLALSVISFMFAENDS